MEYADSILAVGEKTGPIHAILAHSLQGDGSHDVGVGKSLTCGSGCFLFGAQWNPPGL
jgi:hypothetical protein